MVIDASVAAKWFLQDTLEGDTDLALEILAAFLSGDLELHAPRIFTYEVCGLLTKACSWRLPTNNGFRLTKEQAVRCAHEFFGLPIRIAGASEAEGCEALEMAVDYSKQHYDMTYVRLAQNLDCQWCTADMKADEAVPPAFPSNRILHLQALRSSP
ncbi:MAG: type II toxin-antitoxin system VapC family toxin [Planctomycetes bacterium]|nr:type II toxin-antitoxin system VapC family toxin [Planctomycetota bacterium]